MHSSSTDTAATQFYTLSLHDALPISVRAYSPAVSTRRRVPPICCAPTSICAPAGAAMIQKRSPRRIAARWRSEEHTSELQSLAYLVCRLLLEKKNYIANVLNHR